VAFLYLPSRLYASPPAVRILVSSLLLQHRAPYIPLPARAFGVYAFAISPMALISTSRFLVVVYTLGVILSP